MQRKRMEEQDGRGRIEKMVGLPKFDDQERKVCKSGKWSCRKNQIEDILKGVSI